jgi:concentrative nucleoside transporter, CNT family
MGSLVALLGIAAVLGTCYLMSNNRKAISWRLVAAGIGLQVVFAFLILKVPGGREVCAFLGDGIQKLLDFAMEGATFVVGEKYAKGEFIFLVRVGASIIFMSALTSLAYYLGILQRIVKALAKLMTKTMGVSGAEALSAGAEVFIGQVEAQLVIKPYIARLTNSEILSVMSCAMATISGGILIAYVAMGISPEYLLAASFMTAPSALVIAKMLYPETDRKALEAQVEMEVPKTGANPVDALANGATEGAKIAANVMVMLIAAVAFVAMLNWFLAQGLGLFGITWQVQDIFGALFTPVAWLLGVPWDEAFHVGRLMAVKTLLNEFIAYSELAPVIAGNGAYVLSAKSQLIATVALCGFANLGSIAINIGGLGAMAPERRSDIAKLGVKALVAATLASWLTAAIAGLLF